MQTQTFEVDRAEALSQWHAYNTALKTKHDRYLKDMKRVYHALKDGKKVLDLFTSLKMAGLSEKNQPRMAICPADATRCTFDGRWQASEQTFYSADDRWRRSDDRKVILPALFYPIPTGALKKEITCRVPMVPPQFLPEDALSGYWLLWEVDDWTDEPPTDPMLLKRMTPNMFVVLAAWDLTPLERSVLLGRS